MLERQAQAFDRASRPDTQSSPEELQKTARDAGETLNQLKRIVEQEPTRDAFGQSLHDALRGEKKVELDAKLKQLQQQPQEAARNQELASQAKEGLERVKQAFGDSQPQTAQNAQRSDTLKPSGQESFSQGLAKLDSLLKQLQKAGQPPRADQSKQGQEALYDLQSGMRSQYGDNERGNQLLLHLQEMLKAEGALEPGDLRKLMDELERFSLETSDRLAKNEEKPDVTNIDPARLPPAYRGRIQKYFQKLSEK
jgi:ABC-type transporter Mla subunit MlaD